MYVVMSAADRTAESAAKSVLGGSQDYLFKPLIKALLIKKVETLLEIVKGYGCSSNRHCSVVLPDTVFLRSHYSCAARCFLISSILLVCCFESHANIDLLLLLLVVVVVVV
jgi:hypothetical protein